MHKCGANPIQKGFHSVSVFYSKKEREAIGNAGECLCGWVKLSCCDADDGFQLSTFIQDKLFE
jgi:hypothetical protein